MRGAEWAIAFPADLIAEASTPGGISVETLAEAPTGARRKS